MGEIVKKIINEKFGEIKKERKLKNQLNKLTNEKLVAFNNKMTEKIDEREKTRSQ